MEFCLHGDTKIAVPGGYKTLRELSEEFGLDREFIVYSYDHSKGELVPAMGKQARKTTTDHAWRVTFENGQELIGTANHRLMSRDGSYKRIDQLLEGDSMMPFYRKDLVGSKDETGKGYRWIYTMHEDEGRRAGWIAEHILIAEWASGRRLTTNEVVHHINFDKNDNTPENLIMMDRGDHLSYHQKILNEQRKDNPEMWNAIHKRHSEFMKANNPAARKDITFEKILSLCDQYGFNQKNICSMLDTDPLVIKRRLNSKGFASFTNFAKAYDSEWSNLGQDNRGDKNPRFDNTLDFQMICDAFEKGMSSNRLAEKLDSTYMKISNRIKKEGYKNYTDFSENYNNHKVAKIEYYGHIDLYDLTVDGYKNFATDTVISHNTPEIASSLDIYADEMTTHSLLTPILHVKCPNDEIKYILHELYYNIMNIEHNLFGWARTMCKYGDMFLYLDIDEEKGLQTCLGLPPQEIERLEGEDKTNPNYVQFQWNSAGLTLENWQMAHFRILGNDQHAPYGTSVLEPSRRIWRQLTLLEDAMMAYRITRSPERKVFKIDVGGIAPQDVEGYMQKVMTQMKRHQVVDPSTGRVDLRYNPLSVEEDYYLPVRGGQSSTEIVPLPGGQFTAQIEDVKYLRDKLFSALKVPQSYLSMGEGGTEDKTTLAQKDIRFARTIQRLQRVILAELEKIGIVHLYTLGFRGDDLLGFKLALNNPSKIAELQELEHWKTKFDIASAATESLLSRRWVSENLLGLTQDEYLRMQREIYTDKKFLASIEAAGQAPEEGGLGGGGDGLGDLGGMDDSLGDIGGDDEAETGEQPEGDLLAEPPAKRSDSAKPRGPYKKHKLTYNKGGLKKQMLNTASGEIGTSRKTFPGKVGYGGLDSLAKGVTESSSKEEVTLFKAQAGIKALLESMSKKKEPKDET
tara:strand:- start:1628 stop:4363 length:2736 start_codon:yes stop_codon:yes gene_type:complete